MCIFSASFLCSSNLMIHFCKCTDAEVQYVLSLSWEEKGRKGVKNKGKENWCSSAKNCHSGEKAALQGSLIIIQPCTDFTLQGHNDHLMKGFICQIHINYSILLNVSVFGRWVHRHRGNVQSQVNVQESLWCPPDTAVSEATTNINICYGCYYLLADIFKEVR